jgi:hypothetical protein
VSRRCRCHCRSCGACFTSLQAFDSHRVGPWQDRRCELGDELVEIPDGECHVADPLRPKTGVTLYGHPDAEQAQRYFRAIESRETARTNATGVRS